MPTGLGSPLGNPLARARTTEVMRVPVVSLSTLSTSGVGPGTISFTKTPTGNCARVRLMPIGSGEGNAPPFEIYLDKAGSSPTLSHVFMAGTIQYISSVTGSYASGNFNYQARSGSTPTVLYAVDILDNIKAVYSNITISTTPQEIVFPPSAYRVSLVNERDPNLAAIEGNTQVRIILDKGSATSFHLYEYANGSTKVCHCIFDGKSLYRNTDGSNNDFSKAVIETLTFL